MVTGGGISMLMNQHCLYGCLHNCRRAAAQWLRQRFMGVSLCLLRQNRHCRAQPHLLPSDPWSNGG
jgi:hypothetical protein